MERRGLPPHRQPAGALGRPCSTTTAERLRAAGFAEVETGLHAAPTVLPDADEYRAFLANVIFGAHLARLPDNGPRQVFVEALTEQAAADDPPFWLDYWRLNLRGRRRSSVLG